MGETTTKSAVRWPRAPGAWMAIILCVALLAALCTPSMAAFTKKVGAACYSTPGDGSTWTNSNLTLMGTGYYTNAVSPCGTGVNTQYAKTHTTSSAGTWAPYLAFGGWYVVQMTHGGTSSVCSTIVQFQVYNLSTTTTETTEHYNLQREDVEQSERWNSLEFTRPQSEYRKSV